MPNDKQYYVKLDFEFGVDNNGEFETKNKGGAVWVSMPIDDAVMLENMAIIPAMTLAMEEAGKLGLESIGGGNPGNSNNSKPNK
jgi:hypothetical protein